MTVTCRKEGIQEFAQFALLEKLGDGSLGSVFKAVDQDHGCTVALRILGDGIRWDIAVRERFTRVCQSLASLKHPGIAVVVDFGQEGSAPYVATELLDGADLRTIIGRKSDMPVETKLVAMIQVAEGLNYAHENNLTHCDLKPANIHLCADGNARIRDFGIAQLLMKHLVHPGVRWGSAIYLSPEQINGNGCSHQSDMFSAGVVLYEWLTWTHPFHDSNSNKAVDRILFETKLPGAEAFPELPSGIWAIINRCLAKAPKDRYATMIEFADELRAVLAEMGKECQMMLAELLSAIPRVRTAAQMQGAPLNTVSFLKELEKLLDSRQKRDFASLDRLMASLLQHYPTIQDVAETFQSVESQPLPSTSEDSPRAETPLADSCLQPEPEKTVQPSASDRAAESIEGADNPANPVIQAGDINTTLESDSAASYELAAAAPAAVLQPPLEVIQETLTCFDGSPVDAPAGSRCQDVEWETGSIEPAPPPNRRIPHSALRTTAALLSVLLIAVAAYIVRLPGMESSFRSLVRARGTSLPAAQPPSTNEDVRPEMQGRQSGQGAIIRTLLNEAQTLASQHRFEESRLFIRRILELDPACEPAIATLRQIDSASSGAADSDPAKSDLKKELAGVATLLNSGQLSAARTALDRLQRMYPTTQSVMALRRLWETVNNKALAEQKRREEKLQEEARVRRTNELFAHGRYDEAREILTAWIADDPANPQAQALKNQVDDVQRTFRVYESALAENKYQEALRAVASLQQKNPSDPSLARLRSQVETRIVAARATLTVRRLGGKAALLLDGRPFGSNGEAENESIPIGSHVLALMDQQTLQASRTVEFSDGQRSTFVYDLRRQTLRPMAEGDAELLARARALEEVHRFAVEHVHGLLRGACKGMLAISPSEVVYEPTSGSHRFQIPLNRLRINTAGKTLDISYASDGKAFQNFRVEDAQTAENAKRIFNELQALERRQAAQ